MPNFQQSQVKIATAVQTITAQEINGTVKITLVGAGTPPTSITIETRVADARVMAAEINRVLPRLNP